MSKIEEILYLLKHEQTQRYIENSLRVSRHSIRKYKAIAESYGFDTLIDSEQLKEISSKVENDVYKDSRDRYKHAQEQLKCYHEQICEYLKCHKITDRQIYRLLCEQGLKGCSEKSLSRYIDEHFPKPKQYTIHLESEPGIEAQVDYADVGIMFGKKTYVFIMTLAYSRYRYVEFVHSQNVKSWCQSHINAFKFFGAVPKTIVIDNLKSGVIKPDLYDPLLNKSYSELSRHYDFIIDTAKVRKPQHKGKVERSVEIVRQQVIAGRYHDSLADANLFARRWCEDMISDVECSATGKTPKELFIQEKPLMLKLNPIDFDICTWHSVKVNENHHVVINGSQYSLPTKYIGLKVDARVGFDTVKLYLNNKFLKCHKKADRKGLWMTDTNDYPEHISKYVNAKPDTLIDEAKSIGEFTHTYILEIMKEPSRINIRKAISVLNLSDKYEPERLEQACLRACTFDNYEYKSLKNILEKNLDSKSAPTFSTVTTQNAFIRSATEYEENNYAR